VILNLMSLMVDAGNTLTKWALLEGADLKRGVSFSSDPHSLHKDLDNAWSTLMPPKAILVSNVKGAEFRWAFDAWVFDRWGLGCHYLLSEANALGVSNGYDDPQSLGVDRWLAILAARNAYPLPLCVVDCGTATTLDFLDADGCHLGGLIAPGFHAMSQTLSVNTTLDVSSALNSIGEFPGRVTGDCINLGILLSTAGLIDKAVASMKLRLKADVLVLLTGGDAEIVSPYLSVQHERVSDLIFRGMLLKAVDMGL